MQEHLARAQCNQGVTTAESPRGVTESQTPIVVVEERFLRKLIFILFTDGVCLNYSICLYESCTIYTVLLQFKFKFNQHIVAEKHKKIHYLK